MKPKIKGVEEYIDEEQGGQSYIDLIQSFGGKKQKSRLKSALGNRITDQEVKTKVQIEQLLKEKFKGQEDTNPPRKDLPPYDQNATTCSKAYNIKKIIPNLLWPELLTQVLELNIKTKSDLDALTLSDEYPESVSPLFSEISIKADENKKNKMISVLLFQSYLIRFYKTFKNNMRGTIGYISSRLNIPKNITFNLLKLFTYRMEISERNFKYTMDKTNKVKLINYIIVVALVLSGYILDLTPLVADLSMNVEKILIFARSIGCQISKKTKKPKKNSGDLVEVRYFAKLLVPLEFPEFNKKSSGRRDK
eukprot:TRINITY_DN2696_c0_g2_i2.p1 TRINITY_DN2696_c0_g2~~TRINITY_DN2696_c0_g2_i2.p1  ORF type:complete len:307 (-),score=80.64 TRINITY_DN2696_c0_g2_i2:185-1105(-)